MSKNKPYGNSVRKPQGLDYNTSSTIYMKQDGSLRAEDDQDRRTMEEAKKAASDARKKRTENKTLLDRFENAHGVGALGKTKTATKEARQAGKKAKDKVLKRARGARTQGEINEQYPSKGTR